VLTAACAAPPDPELARLEAMAASVTIARDSYGVPHVDGPTDASVVFGYAYARAEDQFPLIETWYIVATGRTAEYIGPEGLPWDVLVHATEVEGHAKAEYERLRPELRALCDAYAAGIRYYLLKHPEQERRTTEPFEPWYPLAGERAFWNLYGFFWEGTPWHGIGKEDVLGLLPEAATVQAATSQSPRVPDRPASACNTWSVGPSRSADGHAMLLIDVHIPLEPTYEFHLRSAEGLHVAGFANYGYGILPISGFNEKLGFMLTNNFTEWVSLYAETFDDPDDPLAYRFGDGYREAEEWADTIGVKGDGGIEELDVTFRKTHHGPILARRDGRPIAVRVGKMAEGGMLDQFDAMYRAATLEEFKSALDINAITNQNVGYADADGNIYYVYNGLIPRRDPRLDWSQPVDGSDPGTEWQGFHTLAERPQVLDPPSGFVHNCNSSPFLTTAGDNPDPEGFPPYMVSPRDRDSARSRMARRILTGNESFTYEQFCRTPSNNHLLEADDRLPGLLETYRALDAEDPRKERLRPAVEELERWDHASGTDSVATTLFVLWFERAILPALRSGAEPGDLIGALDEVMTELESDWGTWSVPYGEINRLQRVPGAAAAPPDAVPAFSDDRESVAIAGAPSWLGTVNAFYTVTPEGSRRRYGRAGRANTAMVEFGDRVRARSITPFGVSLDPGSPHFTDQMALYAAGELKPMWFNRDELEGHTERSYHPGRE